MKSRIPYPQSLFLLGAVLVILAAVVIRHTESSWNQGTLPDATATSSIPDFTSATFPDGDALKGIGPDWTYIRQTPETRSASAPDGTSSTRDSVIQSVNHAYLKLLLEEGDIHDRKTLDAFIEKRVKTGYYTTTTIAGRDGYFVKVADIMNSTGFLLIGTQTYLLISGPAANWPTTLEPEVSAYIGSVRVP